MLAAVRCAPPANKPTPVERETCAPWMLRELELLRPTMRVVVALGGNALLRRGQPLTAENQRANARAACRVLAPVALEHELVISHGNGPQVGAVLASANRGQTRLIIAHRAATAARTDLVAWLDRGAVRSLRPHRELWRDPDYRALFGSDALATQACPAESWPAETRPAENREVPV